MNKLSVVVGRMQVDELHIGHRAILSQAAREADHILVVLGYGPLPSTHNNPLPVMQRREMVFEYLSSFLPDYMFTITSLADHPSDEVWSQNLDDLIGQTQQSLFGYSETGVYLYHGRDSFASYYHGNYTLFGIPDAHGTSATERRREIASSKWHPVSKDFRRGIIYANQIKFPTLYGTVDAAVIKWTDDGPQLLAIRKPHSQQLMLPGGFSEPGSNSDEEDALREVEEETTVIASNARYLGSYNVNDWRYRSEVDAIRTRLFMCDYVSGEPVGTDDAAWAGWVDLESVKLDDFHPCHQMLLTEIMDAIGLYFAGSEVVPSGSYINRLSMRGAQEWIDD